MIATAEVLEDIGFYATCPAYILYDSRLSAQEKLTWIALSAASPEDIPGLPPDHPHFYLCLGEYFDRASSYLEKLTLLGLIDRKVIDTVIYYFIPAKAYNWRQIKL